MATPEGVVHKAMTLFCAQSAFTRQPRQRLTDVSMPRAALASPPAPPSNASRVKMGRYCIKATCRKIHGDGEIRAHIEGFDTDLSIARRVCEACKRRRAHGETCAEPELVFISGDCGRDCCGEMYYTANGARTEIYS